MAQQLRTDPIAVPDLNEYSAAPSDSGTVSDFSQ